MSTFIPLTSFPNLTSLPRSYFLGHHRSGFSKMKTMLSSIDLVIECRDYRIPLTSRNPMFEDSLGGKDRMILYTKQDLGSRGRPEDHRRETRLRNYLAPTPILFSDHKAQHSIQQILNFLRSHSIAKDSLTGSRILIVGMPNVGKSSMLNALRLHGVHKRKVAITGAQPGVTRKIATAVKIIEGAEGQEGLYIVDTPGVFVPYVPDAEAMLKLALCGSVKDTIIAPITLAGYLLYHLNLHDPNIYSQYHEPTNDVTPLLEAIAKKTGRLQKGGVPDSEAAALWMIQRWRKGHMGIFVLDEVSSITIAHQGEGMLPSLSQAKRTEKEARRARTRRRLSEAG